MGRGGAVHVGSSSQRDRWWTLSCGTDPTLFQGLGGETDVPQLHSWTTEWGPLVKGLCFPLRVGESEPQSGRRWVKLGYGILLVSVIGAGFSRAKQKYKSGIISWWTKCSMLMNSLVPPVGGTVGWQFLSRDPQCGNGTPTHETHLMQKTVESFM